MTNDRLYLQWKRNDNREDVQVSLGMFRGSWVYLLIGSVFLFLPISYWCASIEMDLLPMALLGAAPFLVSAVFVIVCVNGRYPSYAGDLFKWWFFQLLESLFMKGWLDKEPVLWPKHVQSHPRR